MNIQLLSLLMLISGIWMALISYYIDFDFLRIDFEQGDERADDKSKGEDLIEMIL